MRIRIQTHSPLPDVKAWFVPDEHNSPETIFDLKEELCRRVQALKNADYHGHNLVLLLEDFELLNDSPFGAVRDGDLVCIKQRSPPKVSQVDVQMESVDGSAVKTHGTKRKRSQASTVSAPAPKKSVNKAPITAPIKPPVAPEPIKPVDPESDYDSDTSSTSSSSSSSSSSISSSKSTSSSSSSSTSSSSSSSSAPEPLSSKKPTIPTPQLNVTHVPPGLGKASTHSRNNRRRKKREFAKLETNLGTTPLKGASEANTTPLGAGAASTNKQRSRIANPDPASIPLPPSPSTTTAPLPATQPPSSSTRPARKKARLDDENTPARASETKGASANGAPAPVYITQDQVMMSSMRNKNKKKGFKLSMANPIPQKITFGDDTTTSAPAQASSQAQSQLQSQTTVEPTQGDPSTLPPSSSTSLFHSTAPAPYVRLVPPSEIQISNPEKVPSNMIITSVDVEAGMWDDTVSHAFDQNQSFAYDQATPNGKKKRGKGKGKDKDKKRGQQTGGRGYGEEEYFEEGQFADESMWDAGIPADVDETMLDYGGADGGDGYGGDADAFDWDRAEKVWDSESTVVVSTPEQLVAGKYVGWKALAINPRTFSPEVLLSVARVVCIQDEANGKAVRIKPIERSSDSETAAAFGLMDGLSGEDGEEIIDWLEVLSSQWRLLDL